MSLSREGAGRAQARCVGETGALSREAEVLLTEVQLSHIVVALTALLFRGDVAGAPRGMVGLKGKLGGDLLKRVLRVGQPELVAEESGF